MLRTWPLPEARARFSELVERALPGEPQLVTRRGRRAVVVLDSETYRRLTRQGRSLWEVLQSRVLESEEALFTRHPPLSGRSRRSYLLDTNVLAETVRRAPPPG